MGRRPRILMSNQEELTEGAYDGFLSIIAILCYIFLGFVFAKMGYNLSSAQFIIGILSVFFLQYAGYRFGRSSK